MESNSGGFATFIPLITMWVILALCFMPIAKRKGKNRLASFLIFIPFYGWFYYGPNLLSLPDKAVLDRLEAIEKHLGIQKESILASQESYRAER
jgi:hypothetical protein